MRIAETFGPTIQGEGPSIGQRANFVRLSGCNLTCCWCDTPYTWDWRGRNGIAYDRATESHDVSVADLVAQLDPGPRLVVITGGEPLLQSRAVVELTTRLCANGKRVEIETNGTLPPPPTVDGVRFNVSPKLDNSGVDEPQRYRPDILEQFCRTGVAAFKFVVVDPIDIDEVRVIVDGVGIDPVDVWIMPEGRDLDTITRRLHDLVEVAVAHGFNVSGRLHIQAWGDQRGR